MARVPEERSAAAARRQRQRQGAAAVWSHAAARRATALVQAYCLLFALPKENIVRAGLRRSAPANFSAVFGSQMVLQREPSRASLCGFSDGGNSVTLTMIGQNAAGVATQSTIRVPVADGHWRATLPQAYPAGGSFAFEVACADCANTTTTRLENVTFGDVLLCVAPFDAKGNLSTFMGHNYRYAHVRIYTPSRSDMIAGSPQFVGAGHKRRWGSVSDIPKSKRLDIPVACLRFAVGHSDRMARTHWSSHVTVANDGHVPLGLVSFSSTNTSLEQWVKREHQLNCANVRCIDCDLSTSKDIACKWDQTARMAAQCVGNGVSWETMVAHLSKIAIQTFVRYDAQEAPNCTLTAVEDSCLRTQLGDSWVTTLNMPPGTIALKASYGDVSVVPCNDNTSWHDMWDRNCAWYSRWDPGCEIEVDVGQRKQCMRSCGGCEAVQMGTLTRSSGILYDGHLGDGYRSNIDCGRTIDAGQGRAIEFRFSQFAVQESTHGFKSDVVAVHDGSHSSSPLLGIYSGSADPGTVYSSGRHMFVRSITHRNPVGWEANWTSGTPGCSCVVLGSEPSSLPVFAHLPITASSGNISGGSRFKNFEHGKQCARHLQAPPQQTVQLTFHDFAVSLHLARASSKAALTLAQMVTGDVTLGCVPTYTCSPQKWHRGMPGGVRTQFTLGLATTVGVEAGCVRVTGVEDVSTAQKVRVYYTITTRFEMPRLLLFSRLTADSLSKHLNAAGSVSFLIPVVTKPVMFSTLNTGAHDSAVYVYDGNSTDSPLIGRFDNRQPPPQVVTSTGSDIFIVYKTDQSTSHADHWSASWLFGGKRVCYVV